MMRTYRGAFEQYASILRMPPEIRPVFNLQIDFRSLSLPRVSAAELRNVLIDKLPAVASIINLSVVIQGVVDTVRESMAKRGQMFSYLRQLPPPVRADAYFGLRVSEDMIDERYSDLMIAIETGVDDAIYFSLLAIDFLGVHGEKLQKQYGANAPELARVTHATLEEGVLPDRRNYDDWEKAYRKAPPPRIPIMFPPEVLIRMGIPIYIETCTWPMQSSWSSCWQWMTRRLRCASQAIREISRGGACGLFATASDINLPAKPNDIHPAKQRSCAPSI